MPYKTELLLALYDAYGDAARAYLRERNEEGGAENAMHCVEAMKTIGRVIGYTHQMIDGTMGKTPLPGGGADQAMQAAIPGRIHPG